MILTSMILAVIYIFLGRNNQVYVGKNGNGERQYKTRKFALWTCQELSRVFRE